MSLIAPIKPLVLIGPSGSGRAAIAFRLACDLPHKFDRLISTTSRKPRLNQKKGTHYYFVSQQQILKKNHNNEFVTFVLSPHNHYYGLQKKQLTRIIQSNKIPILKVTFQTYIKNVVNQIDCFRLYIDVPNMNELEKRLRFGPYDENQIKDKLKKAADEQRQARGYFNQSDIIENQNIQEALIKIKSRLFQLY